LIDDPTPERPTCLVVDDDPAVVRTLHTILGDRRCGPSEFHNAEDVVVTCEQSTPDVLFLDVALGEFDAVDVIRALGERRYAGAIVLISGLHALLADVAKVGERRGLRMLPPLTKPFRAHQIKSILRDFTPPAPAATA
jgi:DNA-binding NtrC family response regulator